MFIRFETEHKDKRTGKYTGIFTLAYEVSKDQELEFYQRQKIVELLNYFEKELPVPKKFEASKSKGAYRSNGQGISWLKSDATEMVSKFWELKIILEDYGHNITVTKSDFIGRIVYSDDFQVVAI